MAQLMRRYPVGIQTFSEVIKRGCVYVDKTDLMWQAQNLSKYIFLSRPRRFGKSLLSTTFASFFRSERELFEGLKVMELEREWIKYPVIHLDMSMAKGMDTAEELRHRLSFIMQPYVEEYGVAEDSTHPGGTFSSLIRKANAATGLPVAVIIDEYDAPLLDVLHEERLNAFRKVMQEFYQTLKASEAIIRFCFITGITKFSQLSIFSTLNNLNNISMLPQFSAICGITETELKEDLREDVVLLAESYDCTPDEMHETLKKRYDGYHFSEASEDIYNPFSLFKSLANKKIDNYWFASGTPTFLIRQMQHFRTDITTMDDITASSSAFDRPTEAMEDALPLLYQAGYLTIKGYDREFEEYQLGIPNKEVRTGFVEGLTPAYLGLNFENVRQGFTTKFYRALKKRDLDLALREMQAYFAGLPYIEGFKKKLDDVTKAEGFYEWTFYLIFSSLDLYARTQVKTIRGRADMVVQMPDAIYVLELKVNGTAEEALAQVNSGGYAIPYQTDGRPVVKAGIRFSTETLTVEDWKIEE